MSRTIARRLLPVLAAALLLGGGSACRSWIAQDEAPPAAAEPVKSTLDNQEKQARAEAILETILTGLAEQDRALYLTHFTAEWQAKFTAANFAKMAEAIDADLGPYQSRQFLGRLDKQVLDIFIWKARFGKADEDALVRLVLGEVDGRLQVFSFSISPY